MSAAPGDVNRDAREVRRRIRRRTLVLVAVALAFYVGFIALSIYRSRHLGS